MANPLGSSRTLVIDVEPETTLFERTARIIAKHMTALADELALARLDGSASPKREVEREP